MPVWGTRTPPPPPPPPPTAGGVIPSSSHFLQPWCEEADIPANRLLDSNGEPLADVDLGWMISAATDLLYVLSGRQWRSGRSVIRPTAVTGGYYNQSYLYPYSSMSGYGSAWGFAAGWAWTAMGMGWWQNGQDLSEVVLQGPVTKINQVMIDGVVLDPSQYSLYESRRLVLNIDATGNPVAWPWQQQLQLPTTEPGTALIDYDWGSNPPGSGRLACAELAIQLALGFSGQDACKLPQRTLTVAQDGVTVNVGDPLSFLLEDLTGLPICDAFLRAYNRSKLRRRSIIIGPNSVVNRSS